MYLGWQTLVCSLVLGAHLPQKHRETPPFRMVCFDFNRWRANTKFLLLFCCFSFISNVAQVPLSREMRHSQVRFFYLCVVFFFLTMWNVILKKLKFSSTECSVPGFLPFSVDAGSSTCASRLRQASARLLKFYSVWFLGFRMFHVGSSLRQQRFN